MLIQTDRDIHTETDRQIPTYIYTHRQSNRQTYRPTDRQTETYRETHTDSHTLLHTYILTHIQKETRHTETAIHKYTDITTDTYSYI